MGDLAAMRIDGTPTGPVRPAPYRCDVGKAVPRDSARIEVNVPKPQAIDSVADEQANAAELTRTAIRGCRPAASSGPVGPVISGAVR